MSDINDEVKVEIPTTVNDGDPTEDQEQDNNEFLEKLYASIKRTHDFIVSIVDEDKKPCKGCYREALNTLEEVENVIEYQHETLCELEEEMSFLQGEIIELEGRNEELMEDVAGYKIEDDGK